MLRLLNLQYSLFTCLLVLCANIGVVAQEKNVFLHPKLFYKKFFPHLRIKKDPPDTSYIRSYPNYLSGSTHLLSPSIRTDLKPVNGEVAGISSFRTNIADIVGLAVNYRFVTAGFAFLLPTGAQMHDQYAKSKYRTATIKYNSRAFGFQFKYIRYKGLTDVNPSYSSDPSQVNLKRADMVSKEFQFENLWNPDWRKYSYAAPLTFSERQIKSRVGFLFNSGLFYTQLSGSSALIPPGKQKYYDGLSDVSVIRTWSIKLAPGVGGNFVFLKRFYFSAVAFPSYDLYFYKYLAAVDDKVKLRKSMVFIFDGKASVGYQSRRLYGGLRYEAERQSSSLHNIDLRASYTYLGVELGYRFNAPKFVRKVYKDTMPPGM
ncbi:MAG: DUF4421 family protein [Chryseolinea sp.]